MATGGLNTDRGFSTAGLVFAGGRSSRMGTDKAMIEIGGRPLIARVLSALDTLGDVWVVGGPAEIASGLGVQYLADEFPGEGPLGALLTGLRKTDTDIVVATACDLPRLRRSTVTGLVDEVVQTGSDIAVPMVGGRLQWHVAAWRSSTAPVIERAFNDGVRSLHQVANSLRLSAVVFADHDEFVDLDTPDDIRREFPE